jgi:hypothetical protein
MAAIETAMAAQTAMAIITIRAPPRRSARRVAGRGPRIP